MMTTAALISEMRAFPLNTSFQRTIRSASESKRELVILHKTDTNCKSNLALIWGIMSGNPRKTSSMLMPQLRDRPDG